MIHVPVRSPDNATEIRHAAGIAAERGPHRFRWPGRFLVRCLHHKSPRQGRRIDARDLSSDRHHEAGERRSHIRLSPLPAPDGAVACSESAGRRASLRACCSSSWSCGDDAGSPAASNDCRAPGVVTGATGSARAESVRFLRQVRTARSPIAALSMGATQGGAHAEHLFDPLAPRPRTGALRASDMTAPRMRPKRVGTLPVSSVGANR